jgi:acetoin utilization protein AcuB
VLDPDRALIEGGAPVLDPPVNRYMTVTPCVIAPDATLATALEVMRRRSIRHLPVMRGDEMVGIVSDRDLCECKTVPHFDPDLVTVEEIMQKDVLVVPPQTTIADVAETMLARKAGSAVVADHGRLVGIFTTMDALRSLAEILHREC